MDYTHEGTIEEQPDMTTGVVLGWIVGIAAGAVFAQALGSGWVMTALTALGIGFLGAMLGAALDD